MKRPLLIAVVFFLLASFKNEITAQYVYATPSGERYHLESCHHAKTANKKLSIREAKSLGLTPCRVCKPTPANVNIDYGRDPDMSATNCVAVQCQGFAKTKGRRCKRKTKNCNGYCHQHQRD